MKQKYKGTELTKTKTVNNILRYYDLATKTEILRGKNWYRDANYFADIMQQRHGHKKYQIVGIIAALSPQTNWQENKRIAELFLLGYREELHNGQQLFKAEQCLEAKKSQIFKLLTKDGKKTSYFYNNILYCNYDNGVTIDRHAIGVCTQKPNKVRAINNNGAQITKRQYDFFQTCFNEAAKKVNILPHELQAIVWSSYRRLRGLPSEYATQSH
jgi:hypothetical protein